MHRALSQLGKAWWVLRHPGWMGTGPGCPELVAAMGRLSNWILTVAEDRRYFQGIYQYRLRPWAFPVDHPGVEEMLQDECTGILVLNLSLFLKR